MPGRLPTLFALISLTGCMTMTDPFVPGAQADTLLISAAEAVTQKPYLRRSPAKQNLTLGKGGAL